MVNIAPINTISINLEILDACHKGRVSKVKQHLRKGCSFNFVNENKGVTPLMFAAASKSDEVFQLVLEQTSFDYLHKVDNEGSNVLFYACASDSLPRVKTIFEEKKVKVLRNSLGKFSLQSSKNKAIHELLHLETQRIIDIHGAILADAFKKHGKNQEALREEVYQRTGQRLKSTPIAEFQARGDLAIKADQDIFKKLVLENPTTKQEIKESFETNTPKSKADASRKLQEKYGIHLTKNQTREVLNEVEITTKSDVLRSKEVKLSIAQHFKANRPKNVEEAIQYIKEKYDCTCRLEQITPFLKYCGISFDD